jgi:hypothetical protein
MRVGFTQGSAALHPGLLAFALSASLTGEPEQCYWEVGPLKRRAASAREREARTADSHTPNCLARIIYHLVRNKQAYDESIFIRMEEEHTKRQHQRLKRQAQSLGFTLTPISSDTYA